MRARELHSRSVIGGSRAFTLIELLVALIITAGIAGATVMAISQMLRARDGSRVRQEASARADAAVSRIAADIRNVTRSGDLFDARVLLVDGGTGGVAHDELLLFAGSTRQARPASVQNEGGVYEVQYRMQAPPVANASAYVLWRRMDPVPDEVTDGGGVASPIVEGIIGLSIEAHDGSAWHTSWDSDRDGVPHAVRVEVTTVVAGRPTRFTARRIVGIDRTPVPYATTEQASVEAAAPAGGGR